MKTLLVTIWTVIRELFSGRSSTEEAWIDNDAVLTPREGLIRRVTTILQWGAIVQTILLVIVLGLLASGNITPATLAPLFLTGIAADDGTLTLVGLIAIGANASLLLLLAAGISAQELWSAVMVIVLGIANILALALTQFYPAILALIPIVIAVWIGAQDITAFHNNAVTVKELRGRMRGSRSFAIITIFLLLMGAFTVLLYLLQLPRLATQDTIITGELGRLLFFGVVGVELGLIVFIVPALTAGAITGERERKTYDLLQTTLLSAPAFIVGKMESALGYILLLLLSAIPLQSIAFLFGGISTPEVGVAFVLLMVTALALGALGMFFSALTERTMTATVRVYTVAVVAVFGLPVLGYTLFAGAFQNAILGVRVVADTPAREAFLIYGDMLLASLNPVMSAFYTQQMLIDQQQIGLLNIQLATDGSFIPVIAPWILTAVIYTAITAILLALAVRQMRRSQ